MTKVGFLPAKQTWGRHRPQINQGPGFPLWKRAGVHPPHKRHLAVAYPDFLLGVAPSQPFLREYFTGKEQAKLLLTREGGWLGGSGAKTIEGIGSALPGDTPKVWQNDGHE